MSTLTALNWVVVILSLPGIPLTRHRPVIGWIYSIGTQLLLWFPNSWWSTQYASVGFSFIMIGLYSWNLLGWRHGPPATVLLAALKTLYAAKLIPHTQYVDLCTAVRERRHIPLTDLVSVSS